MTTTREYNVELVFDEHNQMIVSESVWNLWIRIKFDGVNHVVAERLDDGDYLLTLKDEHNT